jgi:hypothetical protein
MRTGGYSMYSGDPQDEILPEAQPECCDNGSF